MTLQAIIDDNYLRQKAVETVKRSIKELENNPALQQAFVEDTLHNFEGLNNPPMEILDYSYLTYEVCIEKLGMI